MRSRLTCSKPASRASFAAATARPGVWVRSSTLSTCSAADCMPSEIRVKPASRSRAKNSGEVDSGLDSVVTSASSAKVKCRRAVSSRAASPSPPSSDGVPPPTKTVETGTSPSARRASASSPSIASAHACGEVDAPSSPAV